MMREFLIERELASQSRILSKKAPIRYKALYGKISEIVNSRDVNRYKNLKAPLNRMRRVHVDKSFVLLFSYDKRTNRIIFHKMEHHDKAYK